jgi:hypothetical protein
VAEGFTHEEMRRAFDEGADMADRGFSHDREEMDLAFQAILERITDTRMRLAAMRLTRG